MCQGIRPVTEGTFGVLHDVALVDDRHVGLVVVNGVLNGFANQALCPLARNRLDTDTRGIGEPDFAHTHFVLQKLDEFLRLLALGFVLDAGINVFRVFAEDDHVDLVWLFHGAWHALEVLHGAQADVQVKLLAQGHVQRTDAPPHRRGQRPLDGHQVLAHGSQGFFRQPHIRTIHLSGFFARVNFHPVDFFLPTVSLGHGSIHHFDHHGGDVHTRAVTLDVGDDGLVRHIQRQIGVDGDLLPCGGYFDVLVHGGVSPVGTVVGLAAGA